MLGLKPVSIAALKVEFGNSMKWSHFSGPITSIIFVLVIVLHLVVQNRVGTVTWSYWLLYSVG